MAKLTCDRGLYNVVMVSLAYLCTVTTMYSLQNLAKVVVENMPDHPDFTPNANLGYVIFECCLVGSVLVAPFLIRYIPPKWIIVICECFDLIYPLQYFNPKNWLFYCSKAVTGIFCAFNNVATGTVLAMNSRKEDMERNASLHWLIAEISKIIGNVFVLLIMGKGGMVPWKMRALFGTFAGFIVMAGVIASALRKPLVQSKTPPSPMKILMGIWRLVSNRDMWLYMITFSYVGWLGAYQVGIYSSKVAYTPAFHGQIGKHQAAAFSGMFIGVGETVAAFFFALFGRRIHYIGGYWVVITGCLIHTIAYFIIFINIPDIVEWKELIEGIQITHPGGQALASSNLKLAFFCSFLLGLGDSAFHTQIYALLGSVFERETSSAIMIFKISQKASSSLGYFIIDRIGNYATIGCLSVLLILGTATFTYVQQHPTYVSYNPVLVYTDDTSQTRDYKNADEVIDAERREEEARIQERLKAKEEKMSTRKFFRKTKEAQKEEQ